MKTCKNPEITSNNKNNVGKKQTRIAFLKTHKTGSSTLTSILNRVADHQRSDVAIPRHDVRFNWPAPFSHQYVQLSRLRTGKADMLNLHSVLNYPEIQRVMKAGFRMVTILRNPVHQFYSMFHYLKLPKHYGISNYTDPVEEFIRHPYKYHHFKPYTKVGRERYFEENLIHNGNLYDLDFARFKDNGAAYTQNAGVGGGGGDSGGVGDLPPKDRGLNGFIQFMEQAFHLVLITERYDESLVLLKRLMCWEFMDIVYSKKHVNPDLHVDTFRVAPDTADSIRAWNRDDTKLYEHFSKRLDTIIATQNQQLFNEDLQNFRKLNTLVLRYCAFFNNSTKSESVFTANNTESNNGTVADSNSKTNDEIGTRDTSSNFVNNTTAENTYDKTETKTTEGNNDDDGYSSESDANSADFHNILEQLKAMGETPHTGFLESPDCFCKKMERNEREYMYFFAKRFPPFYFMKGMSRPQSTDEC